LVLGLGLGSARTASDSVAETVAKLATATVSNVIGMIGTEAGLNVQVVAMKMKWSSPHESPRHLFHSLSQHRLAQQDRRAVHPRSVYIPPRRPMPRLALRRPPRVCDSPLQHPRSPEPPFPRRRIAGAHARTRPAPPVDTTQIRARPRAPAVSTSQWAQCLMSADPRCSPLSPSSLPPTFPTLIWRCPWRAAGLARATGWRVLPCAGHAARRVPHRFRKSRPPTTRRRSARRSTTSTAGAALRLTGGAHARPRM